jgi:hypothetical protein
MGAEAGQGLQSCVSPGTSADGELLFKSLIRQNDESTAIFARLQAPLEFRRESKDVLRYLRQQSVALADALRAFRHRRRAALLRSLRRFARAHTRIGGLLVDLGVGGCRVEPITVPDASRVKIV